MIGACRTDVGIRDFTCDVVVTSFPPDEKVLVTVETTLVEYCVMLASLI